MDDLKPWLKKTQKQVDSALSRFLPREVAAPQTIHKAMRYSIFAGGKRLRPILALAAAEACGGKIEAALAPACATEIMHTYSLVHDDLPCMDDDDLRRGRPTSHKVFGEGMAVLTGDALLTQVFIVIAQTALLVTSVRLGAMSANTTPTKLEALTAFGYNLGLAFQVIDDILDVTQTTEILGKTAGKDEAVDKSTYPAILGLEKSRQEAARLTKKALRSLEIFGKKGQRLKLTLLS